MTLDGQGWLQRAADPLPAFSANPLELLPARQRLVFLAKAYRTPMAHAARVLGLSRETVYQDLKAATRALTPRRGRGSSALGEEPDTPASPSMEPLLKPKQVAQRLGLTTDGVAYLVARGQLTPAMVLAGGERLFAPAAVDALVAARRKAPPKPGPKKVVAGGGR